MPRLAALALLVLCVPACGVGSKLDKLEAESDETVDLVCACSNIFPDRAACEAQFGGLIFPFDRDCLEDALAKDKKASNESLDCALDNMKDYNKCLSDNLDCNDQTSFEPCQSIVQRECPQLPQAVQEELNKCPSTLD